MDFRFAIDGFLTEMVMMREMASGLKNTEGFF